MQSELLATLILFVNSTNREIVKSALGFAKIATITISTSIVRPQLAQLVPALLSWSHDHKNHFKTKVLHIFERMGRRFGWEEVFRCADAAAEGENQEKYKDGRAVLENLKKRKDKAKKRKANVAATKRGGEEASEVCGRS
jgi:ribosomal RNA-processing protein 12